MAWKSLLPSTIEDAGIVTEDDTTAIPYRRPDGTTFRTRYKAWDGRTWWGKDGNGTIPFGLERLPSAEHASSSALIICEGESDTLALLEVIRDRYSHLFTIGCPGAHAWAREWLPYVSDFKYVIALGDGDRAGNDFVERTRSLIPRAIGATVPAGDDVRSIIQERSAEDIMSLVREMVELEAMIRKYFPPL